MKFFISFNFLILIFTIGCTSIETSFKDPSRSVAQVKPKSILAMCYGIDDSEACLKSGVETLKSVTACIVDEVDLKITNCQYSQPQSSPGFDGGVFEYKGVLYCQIPTKNCMSSQIFGESEHHCPEGFNMKKRRKTESESKKFAWISSIYCEQ